MKTELSLFNAILHCSGVIPPHSAPSLLQPASLLQLISILARFLCYFQLNLYYYDILIEMESGRNEETSYKENRSKEFPFHSFIKFRFSYKSLKIIQHFKDISRIVFSSFLSHNSLFYRFVCLL